MDDSLLDSNNLGIGCRKSKQYLVSEQETLDSSDSWMPAVADVERGEMAQARTVVL